ncbi:MAG: hypothetical protein NTW82_10525 [Bacteroidia bacterium]|nr:hypothetical protein [Bacteroidia bacterium]
MQDIGTQYPEDDKTDPSGFLRRARLHQSKFRAEVLNLPYNSYGNYLTKEDGEAGNNFYQGFGIFDAVKKYRKYNKPLYSNMLRSEHIPFNFFIPFNLNKTYCKNVFNEFFGGVIQTIERIEIEFAPNPREKYLNDGTSFDTYIEYSRSDNSKGLIGIEVKYTEKEYRLEKNSKQERAIIDKTSKYYSVTEHCKGYKPEAVYTLSNDKFRQMWRNQLLGESILLADNDKFKHFTSLTLFPEGNSHFVQTSKEYIELLSDNYHKFLPLTYEDFFGACNKHCPDDNYRKWLNYLIERYIIVKNVDGE